MARIMLADDDYDDVVLTCRLVLESHDYEVDGFVDPELALNAYSDELYDLIVLDVGMLSCTI
jgi:DNA-binding response OmpR family regulator